MADQCIPLRSLAPQIEAALALAPEGYRFRLGSCGVEVTPPDRREILVYMNGRPFRILAVEHPAALAYAVALLDSSVLRNEGTATRPMLNALELWAG